MYAPFFSRGTCRKDALSDRFLNRLRETNNGLERSCAAHKRPKCGRWKTCGTPGPSRVGMPGQEMDVFDTMGIPAKMVMFYNWETGWWFGTALAQKPVRGR